MSTLLSISIYLPIYLSIYLLSIQGIKKLLPSKEVDRKKELRKLNHSILLNFLDLIEILIKVQASKDGAIFVPAPKSIEVNKLN